MVLHRYTAGELDPQIFLGENIGRQQVQNVPKLTYSLSGTYRFPVMEFGELAVHLDWVFRSQSEPSTTNRDNTRQNAFGLLNGRITLYVPNQNIEIAFWGKNLTDRRYNFAGIDFRAWRMKYMGPPRQVGVELTYRFGSEAN